MSTVYTVACDTCGHTASGGTAAVAAEYLRRHSCRRQQELAARAIRVAKAKNYHGETRDCQHKHTHHEHGTRTAYVLDRCKCRPCLDANRREENTRRRAQLYGRYDVGRVDAQPVREHIRELMAAGIGVKRIAKVSGVAVSTIGKVLYGDRSRNMPPRARVARHVHERIMAVQPGIPAMAAGASVDATGAHRRAQALIAIGWSMSRVGSMVGMESGNFWRFMKAPKCTVTTHLAMARVYDMCWNDPQNGTDWHSKAAATRARNYAKDHGWAPPLAWDDDEIDNPAAVPAVMVEGRATPEERLEEILMLIHTGCGLHEVMARAGFTRWDSLERFLERNDRNDVARLLRHIKDLEVSR